MLKKIIYVEDEPDIREIAQVALELIGGFKTEIYSSGAEALQKAPAFAPDLIILDVMMPKMDGPTTLRKLREIPCLAQVPVVFMTAKVQPREVSSLLASGAVDVIAKPFDPMTLAQQLTTIWANHHV